MDYHLKILRSNSSATKKSHQNSKPSHFKGWNLRCFSLPWKSTRLISVSLSRRWNHVATSTSVSDLQWSGGHPIFSNGDQEILFHEVFFLKKLPGEICHTLPGFGISCTKMQSMLLEVFGWTGCSVGVIPVLWQFGRYTQSIIGHKDVRLYLDHWVK